MRDYWDLGVVRGGGMVRGEGSWVEGVKTWHRIWMFRGLIGVLFELEDCAIG